MADPKSYCNAVPAGRIACASTAASMSAISAGPSTEERITGWSQGGVGYGPYRMHDEWVARASSGSVTAANKFAVDLGPQRQLPGR